MKTISNNVKRVITIKEMLKSGMKPLQVAKALNISHQQLYKWKNKELNLGTQTRKKKLSQRHLKRIKNSAENKLTAANKASRD